MKRLIVDLDRTLTTGDSSDYTKVGINQDVLNQLRHYKTKGFEIVINTSRNMRTHKSNVGKITAKTLPIIFDWLEKYDVPYDEIWVGKPWCGNEGFYIDDKTIRPDEFVNMSYSEICELLGISPNSDSKQ